MSRRPRDPLVAGTLLWLGFLAVSQDWIAGRRPPPPELRAGRLIVVTSPADSGAGSLREALFQAAGAATRVRVLLTVDRIALRTPLPPLLNPLGVVLDAEASRAVIDASALGDAPVLDLAVPGCAVSGLGVRGAAGPAVLVRARSARLTRLELRDNATGVYLADGVEGVELRDSVFEANGVGVRLPATAAGIVLVENRFRRHGQAGVWGVAPRAALAPPAAGLVLRDNRFEEDRIGVVLIHVPGELVNNEFVRAVQAAIHLMGAAVVRENRLLGGGSFGLFADAPDGAVLEDNELGRNLSAGLLLREARNTVVRRNRVHANGYGLVIVFGAREAAAVLEDNLILNQQADAIYVIGGAPLIRGNRILGSRGAALRILDFVPRQGARRTAEPVIADNVVSGNAMNTPVRGDYRETGTAPERR